MKEPSAIFEIIHSILQETPEERLTVREMCQIAGVSRSGYYAWQNAAARRKAREERDRNDFDLILKAYKHRGYDKGTRSIYMRPATG